MSTRLQVILDDEELAAIQRVARKQHMTTSEWVRQTLRKAQRSEPRGDPRKKLAVVRAAAEHSYPVGDVEQMLEEIERGYLAEGPK